MCYSQTMLSIFRLDEQLQLAAANRAISKLEKKHLSSKICYKVSFPTLVTERRIAQVVQYINETFQEAYAYTVHDSGTKRVVIWVAVTPDALNRVRYLKRWKPESTALSS